MKMNASILFFDSFIEYWGFMYGHILDHYVFFLLTFSVSLLRLSYIADTHLG